MSNRLQIALPAEVPSLPTVRSFVENACAEAGLESQTSYDIKLAVDEACMNIVEHGYAGMDPGSMLISLQYGAQALVVRITDFGHPFEPSEPPLPDPEAMLTGKPGGIGLHFIYRSVDSVSYEATPSGNTLTLVKDLRPEPDEQSQGQSASTQYGNVTVVVLGPELDSSTAPDAGDYLDAEVQRGHVRLVLDLSKVTYLSSAGLRALLVGMRAARAAQGDLRLAGAQGDVHRVLEMSGFTQVIEGFQTVEQAVASYHG
jgi:serine/threonine-protein kinase RsbW